MNAALDRVLQHPGVWRGGETARSSPDAVPTGFAALDLHLPGGGWPRGALTEILVAHAGIGELRLLLPALARLSRHRGWLAWVAPPHVPYAPALSTAGVALERVMLTRPRNAVDAWWAAEQAMRSGACGAVLAWLELPDERRMRRLQLGAENGQTWGVLFRPAAAASERSPAALRLRLEAQGTDVLVHVVKRRGGPLDGPLRIALNRHPACAPGRRPEGATDAPHALVAR